MPDDYDSAPQYRPNELFPNKPGWTYPGQPGFQDPVAIPTPQIISDLTPLAKDPQGDLHLAVPRLLSNAANDLALGPILTNDLLKGRASPDQIAPYVPRATLGVAMGAAGAPAEDATLGVFTVPSQARAQMADQMYRRGATNDEIWQKTGTFRGEDGEWKSEIPDSQADLTRRMGRQKVQGRPMEYYVPDHGLRLGDVYDHPELYKAIPEAANIPVKPLPPGDVRGGYSPTTGEIYLSPQGHEDILSSISHEVNHFLQHRFGFGKGSSSVQFLPPDFNEQLERNSAELASHDRIAEQMFNHPMAPFLIKDALWKHIQQEPVEQGMNSVLQRLHTESPELFESYVNAVHQSAKLHGLRMKADKDYLRTTGEVESRTVQDRLAHGYEGSPADNPVFINNPNQLNLGPFAHPLPPNLQPGYGREP